MDLIWLLVLFAVAGVIGYKTIKMVPTLLHTPLMSGMNALSGITILGALIAAATRSEILGAIAVILATINVVGGFLVTHRMLKMFKK